MTRDEDSPQVAVLGPTRLDRGGLEIHLRPKERAVLAGLALRRGRWVSADELVDLAWDGAAPDSYRKAVQNQILRLRRAGGASLVDTTPDGYALGAVVAVDADGFDALLAEGRDGRRRPDQRAAILRRALKGWSGTAYADLTCQAADGPRARLHEERLVAEEELAAALLEASDAEAVALLDRLVTEEPYRERRWWLLVLARYRSGHGRRAMQELATLRSTLGRSGLVPSARMAELEALVCVDDPRLRTISLVPASIPSTRGSSLRTGRVVGRDAERRRLLRALALGPDGDRDPRRAVIVSGEEGIGKTTLLRAVAEDAAALGATVLWGACDSRASIPLAPFVQILEQLASAGSFSLARAAGPGAWLLGSLSPTLRQALGSPLPSASADGNQRRLFDTVVRALAGASRDGPLLVVIDDLHLALPTTQLLVSHLTASPEHPAMLVATRPRVGPGSTAGPPEPVGEVELLSLEGLDRAEVGEQLGHLLDGPVDADAVDWIHRQTTGNPLFVRELARELTDTRSLHQSADGAWTLRPPDHVPVTLSEGLLQRLERLSPSTRSTLEAAAVVGSSFTSEVLAAMVGDPERELGEALRAGVVEALPAGAFAFRHELLHETLLAAIPEGALLELYESAAEALEAAGTAPPTAVAHHHLATARIDPARAVASARAAGDAALASFAYTEAADWYAAGAQAAADWLGDPRTACELAVLQGDAWRQAGDARCVELLLRAAGEAEALSDETALARAALALCRLGPVSEAGTVQERVADVVERALAVDGDPGLAAELSASASLVFSFSGDQDRCTALFERAEARARATNDEHLLARVLPYAYLGLVDPDDLDRRRQVAEELVLLGTRLGELSTEWEGRQLLFSVQLQTGDPALADSFARLAELTTTLKEPAREWEASYLGAALAHVQGDLEAAQGMADASLGHAGAVAASRVTAAWAIQVFAIRMLQGRLAELVDAIEQLIVEQPGVAAWSAALALARAQADDHAGATAAVEATRCGQDLPRDSTWTGAMCCLAHALGPLGSAGAPWAEPLYAALSPYGGRMSWVGTCTLGPIDAALGVLAVVLGDGEGAARHLDEAERLATRLGSNGFAAQARRLRAAAG